MRVDELNEWFKSKLPPKSKKYERMYAKAWQPPAGSAPASSGQINTGSA